MPSHFEDSLRRDTSLIREKIVEMSGRCEHALRDVLKALVEGRRQTAYLVILRDQFIDELEKEIDRLCLEFLVRQQPVGAHLRFAYSTIKINAALERVGDHAEGVARQIASLDPSTLHMSFEPFKEIGEYAIAMLHDAIRSFLGQDAELAATTAVIEDKVDGLRRDIDRNLLRLCQEGHIPLDALNPLMSISRRLERVTDQARDICAEVLYLCTGEYAKHRGLESFRVLFVDEHNACLSQMAEGIASTLRQPKLVFSSAGIEPKAVDPRLAKFMVGRGIDISRQFSKVLEQVPNWEHYQVIVAFDRRARKFFSRRLSRTVCLDWATVDFSTVQGTEEQIGAAYEEAFRFLQAHIADLAEAIIGHTT